MGLLGDISKRINGFFQSEHTPPPKKAGLENSEKEAGSTPPSQASRRTYQQEKEDRKFQQKTRQEDLARAHDIRQGWIDESQAQKQAGIKKAQQERDRIASYKDSPAVERQTTQEERNADAFGLAIRKRDFVQAQEMLDQNPEVLSQPVLVDHGGRFTPKSIMKAYDTDPERFKDVDSLYAVTRENQCPEVAKKILEDNPGLIKDNPEVLFNLARPSQSPDIAEWGSQRVFGRVDDDLKNCLEDSRKTLRQQEVDAREQTEPTVVATRPRPAATVEPSKFGVSAKEAVQTPEQPAQVQPAGSAAVQLHAEPMSEIASEPIPEKSTGVSMGMGTPNTIEMEAVVKDAVANDTVEIEKGLKDMTPEQLQQLTPEQVEHALNNSLEQFSNAPTDPSLTMEPEQATEILKSPDLDKTLADLASQVEGLENSQERKPSRELENDEPERTR